MIPTLEQLAGIGMLNVFDCQFARRLARMVDDGRPEVLLAAALTSRGVRLGHVCVDLKQFERGFLAGQKDGVSVELRLPQPELWQEILKTSPLVSDGGKMTPLVLQYNRLYLTRYWQYEKRLAQGLLKRAGRLTPDIDGQLLQDGLDRLFAQHNEYDISEQRHAAEIAVRRQLTIISGGPGTGKTTTVTKILALLQEQSLAATGSPLAVFLLAPTGKAAARLSQSVRDRIDGLEIGREVKAGMPEHASTIQRALGYQPRTPTLFRYNRENPLPADVVLVDEASMVDVALMAKLFDAVPETARFILLGDHNQLVSVEVGSILGDICHAAETNKQGGLAECVVYLKTSFRFEKGKGIGRLAEAVNLGKPEKVVSLLKDAGHEEIALHAVRAANKVGMELCQEVVEGYRDYLMAADPLEALQAFERFRVLCAHRHGFGGVEHLNSVIEGLLAKDGLLAPRKDWYKGQPVMIRANNYPLRLFNGDVGIVWPDPADNNTLRVYFFGESPDDDLRSFPPLRLPQHETVFAMTIHKSQGSEFDRVAVVFPPEESPVLSRELLYTAISRAREQLVIFADEDVLYKAITNRIERASGLSDRLKLLQ